MSATYLRLNNEGGKTVLIQSSVVRVEETNMDPEQLSQMVVRAVVEVLRQLTQQQRRWEAAAISGRHRLERLEN